MKNEEDQILRKHFTDLARKADQSHIATFTGFLSLPEQSVFYSMDFSYVPHCVFGGQEGCERAVVRFGEEWEFPICCIKMAPLMNKFADALTHRDFLGALMNLGIERSTLGDIYIEDKTGYLFCLKSMAEYITENLTRIRHTSVQCTVCEEPPVFLQKEPEEKLIQISSARTDALIAGVYHLSRTESNELFREQKVFINGRLCENNSRALKEGDQITVRGYGKFAYEGEKGLSRKGKVNVRVLAW